MLCHGLIQRPVTAHIDQACIALGDMPDQRGNKGRIVAVRLGEKDNIVLGLQLLDERVKLERASGQRCHLTSP